MRGVAARVEIGVEVGADRGQRSDEQVQPLARSHARAAHAVANELVHGDAGDEHEPEDPDHPAVAPRVHLGRGHRPPGTGALGTRARGGDPAAALDGGGTSRESAPASAAARSGSSRCLGALPPDPPLPASRSRHGGTAPRPRQRRGDGPQQAAQLAGLPLALGHRQHGRQHGSTPASETVRSIRVTNPKSRSIVMLEKIRTPKPAIAVIPEASTAAPVER